MVSVDSQESDEKKSQPLQIGDLEIVPDAYVAKKYGEELDLTHREFELLYHLASHIGQVITREHLLETVWGYDYFGDVRTVDVTIRRLREKIEDTPSRPEYILTRRGVGYDTMNFIKADVQTIVMGMAASMGTVIASSGAKGKRFMLPNAEYMIHQPMGGTGGGTQQTDMAIAAEHLLKTRKTLEQILADNSGKSVEQIHADAERDYWMSAHRRCDQYRSEPRLSLGTFEWPYHPSRNR